MSKSHKHWKDYENRALLEGILEHGKDFPKLTEIIGNRNERSIECRVYLLLRELKKQKKKANLSDEN
jgi:hypothetical protein